MDVLLDGIIPLHIGLFFKVTSLKLVDLNKLNGTIKSFSYQHFEVSAKPSIIQLSAVQEGTLTGKQSGISTQCQNNNSSCQLHR